MNEKIVGATVCFFFVFFSPPLACRADTPGDRVRTMLNEVMAIQTDSRLQGDEFLRKRKTAIERVIAESFDYDGMCKEVLGPYGKTLKNDRRLEFEGIFRDLFQDSYTRLVLNFLKQEKISYTKEDVQENQGLIMTRIIRTDEEIPVDYLLARIKNKWLVYDVKIDGVSIVQNYRKSFFRVIKRESFDALLEKMRIQQKAIETTP